jgi:hypothetical protein
MLFDFAGIPSIPATTSKDRWMGSCGSGVTVSAAKLQATSILALLPSKSSARPGMRSAIPERQSAGERCVSRNHLSAYGPVHDHMARFVPHKRKDTESESFH